jgi:hypothetical protein
MNNTTNDTIEEFLIERLGSPKQIIFALIKFMIKFIIVTYFILFFSVIMDKEFFRLYIVALAIISLTFH